MVSGLTDRAGANSLYSIKDDSITLILNVASNEVEWVYSPMCG